MSTPMDPATCEFVWAVMSEFFVDNEIDYDAEAARLARFPFDALRTIFFEDVAPVCGPNLLTPVPPVWLGFDTSTLVAEIRARRARRERSLTHRLRHRAAVLYYRLALADTWKTVAAALERAQALPPSAP
ncbi:hypothetical protein AB4851_05800 [Burkholderia sp. 22PA0099]|uniref:DUF7079 family protein n=1 Tax=Burkholderia sp. 22PA0099 TaxID=3237372 RepID=UPI0039C0A582